MELGKAIKLQNGLGLFEIMLKKEIDIVEAGKSFNKIPLNGKFRFEFFEYNKNKLIMLYDDNCTVKNEKEFIVMYLEDYEKPKMFSARLFSNEEECTVFKDIFKG